MYNFFALIITVLFCYNVQAYLKLGNDVNDYTGIVLDCFQISSNICNVTMDGLFDGEEMEACLRIVHMFQKYIGTISNYKEAECSFIVSLKSGDLSQQYPKLLSVFRDVCNGTLQQKWCKSDEMSTQSCMFAGVCPKHPFQMVVDAETEEVSSSESYFDESSEEYLLKLRRYNVCLEEWTNAGAEQKWCTTPVGRTVFPCQHPCVDSEGRYVTRTCEFADDIPVWSDIQNYCVSTTFSSSVTFLNDVRNAITPSALKDVSDIIHTNSSLLTVLDVDIIADILSSTVDRTTKAEYKDSFFRIVDNVLKVNRTLLRSAREFGSTDKILKSIDSFLIGLSKEIPPTNLSLANIAFEIVRPNPSNLDDPYNFTFEEVTAKIPGSILNTLILTIFKTDSLFPEGNILSRIADLKVLGVDGTLENPVSIYLQTDLSMEVVCSFWKYNDQGLGNWSTAGVETLRISDNLVECKSNHLTAFALLGISDRIIGNISESHQLALQIISTILCVFSLVGLIIVFITCFALKNWHRKRINTIQLSCVIALEIFMLFLNEIITINDGIGCVFYAVFMHYLVLVKFMLMLFIAKMQYENFVTVLTSRNKLRRTLFSALTSFSVPIIVVGISAGIFPENYNSGDMKFCYPKDEAFNYFVIIPIASILLANVIIFSMVMFKISHSISRDYKQKVLQAKLAIMLFFMLGLTWLFSVFAHVVYTQWLQLAFVYIFTILSPLQGFIIFLFAIVMDADARTLWAECYRNLRYAPLERSNIESSNNTTSTAVLMSNVSQSNEAASEQSRSKENERSQDN